MKKLLIAMLVTALLPLSVFGQGNLEEQVNQMVGQENVKVTKQEITDFIKKSQDKYQAIDYENIVTVNNFYNHYFAQTPVCYEPHSETFAFVRYLRDTESDPRTFYIEMFYTQDMGESWASTRIYEEEMQGAPEDEDLIMVYPSFAMMNPDKSSDINDLYYFVYGKMADFNQNGSFTTSRFVLISPDEEEPIDTDLAGPNTTHNWYTMQIASHPDMTKVHLYGSASDPSENNPLPSVYAHAYLDIETTAFENGIPDSWANSNFRESEEGSYNAPVMVDMDDQGNVYACFNNFIKPDNSTRLIGFTKSSDNGSSWTTLESFPKDDFDDFLISNNGVPGEVQQGGSNPYNPKGFKVTGENQFSVFYHLSFNAGDNNANPGFVEVTYDNGDWSIQKVTDWSGLMPYVLTSHTDEDSDEFLGDFYSNNARGHEIQLATTADGQHLVAKWIDHNEDMGEITLDNQLDVYYTRRLGDGTTETDETTIETMYTTDIYITYREIGDDEWQDVKNVSDDLFYNKNTWMPSVVPGINSIPVTSNKTTLFDGTDRNQGDYENELTYEMIVNEGGAVRFSELSYVTSVKDMYSEDIEAQVYPNPAKGNTTIKYNVDEPAHVGVTLYSANGEKLGILQNTKQMKPGVVELHFNADKLNSGTYFYKLEINGQPQVGKFQVVK